MHGRGITPEFFDGTIHGAGLVLDCGTSNAVFCLDDLWSGRGSGSMGRRIVGRLGANLLFPYAQKRGSAELDQKDQHPIILTRLRFARRFLLWLRQASLN